MSKYLAVSLSMVVLCAGCGEQSTTSSLVKDVTSSNQEQEVTPVAFNTEGAPTMELSVPNMHCEFSCAPKVRESLAKQPGVKDVKVDVATKTATVAVDRSSFDVERAIAELEDYGFAETRLKEEGAAVPSAGKSPQSEKAKEHETHS